MHAAMAGAWLVNASGSFLYFGDDMLCRALGTCVAIQREIVESRQVKVGKDSGKSVG